MKLKQVMPTLLISLIAVFGLNACSEKQAADKQATAVKAGKITPADAAHQKVRDADPVRAQKIAEVEAKLQQAIKDDPESAKARAQFAAFLLSQNKTVEAIPAYQDAIMLDPENAKLYAALSIAYLHQGKFNMAKAMADEALKLNPELAEVKKINEYIVTKQQVLSQAEKVPAVGGKPNDALYKMMASEQSANPEQPALTK